MSRRGVGDFERVIEFSFVFFNMVVVVLGGFKRIGALGSVYSGIL